HTRCYRDWSSDVCSSDLIRVIPSRAAVAPVNGITRIVRGCPGKGRVGVEPIHRSDDVDIPRPGRIAEVLRLAAGKKKGDTAGIQIGRASCRERGEIREGG